MSVVYVLHFVDPRTGAPARLAHAAHYVGWCGRGIDSRLAYHRAGRGSRLVAAALAAGLDFVVAIESAGTRTDERRIKRRGSARREVCPVCRGDARVYRDRRRDRWYVRFRPRRRALYELRIAGIRAVTNGVRTLDGGRGPSFDGLAGERPAEENGR